MKRTAIKRKHSSDKVLDDLVRECIRLTSRGYCKRCHKFVGEEMIEAAHLYGRKRKTLRWDLRNVHGLCKSNPLTGGKGCHFLIDNDHISKTSFMYEVLGKEDIEDLQELANKTIKDYPIDREKIKQELKEKIRILEEL